MANEADILTTLMTLMNSGRGSASGTTTTQTGGETIQEGGGGTTTMTGYSSPGDITALQALLGELGGANYQQVLESIFQQAGGKIPGFMGALQNSVGARSGNNSAVAAMLQKLLSETALQGQAQMADLGLRNASLRGNLAANIAQATKGTHQSQTTVQHANPVRTVRTPSVTTAAPVKEPYGAGEMAAVLGIGSLFKNMWDSAKTGKQDAAPVRDSFPNDLTSNNMLNTYNPMEGGQIASDPWATSNLLNNGSNNIFSFTDSPSMFDGPANSFSSADFGSPDLTGDGSMQFDLPSFDFGNWFDSGDVGEFVPDYGGQYDFTEEFWY